MVTDVATQDDLVARACAICRDVHRPFDYADAGRGNENLVALSAIDDFCVARNHRHAGFTCCLAHRLKDTAQVIQRQAFFARGDTLTDRERSLMSEILRQLINDIESSVRRALILSLGEFTDEQLPAAQRQPVIGRLLDWYRHDPDPGVFSGNSLISPVGA